MKVKCLKCQMEYNINHDKIPAGGASATCKKCGNNIKILSPSEYTNKKIKNIQTQKIPSTKKKSNTASIPQIKNPHSLGKQVTGIFIASIYNYSRIVRAKWLISNPRGDIYFSTHRWNLIL